MTGLAAKGDSVCASRPCSFLRAEESEESWCQTASYCNRHDCLNKVPKRSPPEMIRSSFYGGLRAEDAVTAATK